MQTKFMRSKFLSGIKILLISGIVAKILGAIFRIPLTWVLGIDGLGLYQLIYPVFSMLIVLSSSGMPTAVSKLVATKVKAQNYVGAKQVLRVACIFFGAISLIFSIGLFALSDRIASIQGNELSLWGYRAIAPAIFVVSFLSCLRGYFQGMMNMGPTALSQILEQGGKLLFGLILAWALLPQGVEFATSGALLGVTLSEILATLVLFGFYLKQRKAQNTGVKQRNIAVACELIVVAFPIVLTSVVLPVLTFVDSFLVVNLLMPSFPVDVSTQLWGVSSGVVTSLVNLPIALSLSVAVSVVPALVSGAQEKTDVLTKSFDLIFLFTIPVIVGYCLLGESVISFLYGTSMLDDKMQIAVWMLTYSSPIIYLGSVLQTQTSSLQAIGEGKIALISLLVAGGVKMLLTILLVRIPELNIWGFTIANLVFYAFVVGINMFLLHSKLGFKNYFSKFKPVLAGVIMLSLVLLNIKMLAIAHFVKLILAVSVGGGAYIFSIIVFGVDLKKYGLDFLKFRSKRGKNAIKNL